ncbi:uncharacterized protein C8Q71DRAFT_791029, partial [Rhodofomes roseus]
MTLANTASARPTRPATPICLVLSFFSPTSVSHRVPEGYISSSLSLTASQNAANLFWRSHDSGSGTVRPARRHPSTMEKSFTSVNPPAARLADVRLKLPDRYRAIVGERPACEG